MKERGGEEGDGMPNGNFLFTKNSVEKQRNGILLGKSKSIRKKPNMETKNNNNEQEKE